MQEPTHNAPYQPLGNHLRYLREQTEESVAEVSGAVEIDIDKLERIEGGLERPSEDILMLLINHFDMHDSEALRLWELAGYHDARDKLSGDVLAKGAVVLLAVDMRTMYTDGVQAAANKSGVTVTFTHGSNQPVAKVGMSLGQAEAVIQEMQTALLRARYMDGPRQLPPATDSAKDA
jgi:hypothetical protein